LLNITIASVCGMKKNVQALNIVMKYMLLLLFLIVWCTLHSALIGLTVIEVLRRRFPGGFRFYRIAYNLFAVVTLVPILGYAASLKGRPIIAWEGMLRIVPILLWSVGLVFFFTGLQRYDLFQFFGIRQLKGENTCSVLTDDCTLDTGGVLSIVRHPWYSAGILIVWARPLDAVVILTNLVICGYFVVGAMLEERKLKIQFGRQYTDYQQQVSMFFPIRWARDRLYQER